MKSTILSFLLLAAVEFSARAATISQWTFETSVPTTAGSHLAEGGLSRGTALGSHGVAATVYSNPAGNGSMESFSANNWSSGDYWQFQLSTVGFQDITVSWDQTRSGTGPALFDFAYSLDGVNYLTVENDYSVSISNWSSSGNRNVVSLISEDLSSVSTIDNQSMVYFRLTADSTASGTTGSSRIDNFLVSGTEMANVPDSSPGWLGFGSVVALMALAWRRSEPEVS